MSTTTPNLSFFFTGKRIEIDPNTGQFSARVGGGQIHAESWKKMRAELRKNQEAPKAQKPSKVWARPGWWLSPDQIRPAFLLSQGRFGQKRSVVFTEGGGLEEGSLTFDDIAWMDWTDSPASGFEARQEALEGRAGFISEHLYRIGRGLRAEQACDFLRQIGQENEGVAQVEQRKGRRGTLILGKDWELSVVGHGKSQSFLGYHLRHIPCGEMLMFIKPQKAIEFVQHMERLGAGSGRDCVVFSEDQSPVNQLVSGRLVNIKGVVSAGKKEWVLSRGDGKARIYPLGSDNKIVLLTDDLAHRWAGFADIGWASWKKDLDGIGRGQQTDNRFDFNDTQARQEWQDRLQSLADGQAKDPDLMS